MILLEQFWCSYAAGCRWACMRAVNASCLACRHPRPSRSGPGDSVFNVRVSSCSPYASRCLPGPCPSDVFVPVQSKKCLLCVPPDSDRLTRGSVGTRKYRRSLFSLASLPVSLYHISFTPFVRIRHFTLIQ